ncbi:MAG: hypothetical protein WC675_02460 [Patescibacteria group bacterium]|jgi:hypothetical protein
MRRLILVSAVLILFLAGCGIKPEGVSRTEDFEKPDIKDEFCGIQISFQYCKCAFHGQYCDEIGMSKKEADKYVQEEYDKWLKTASADFASRCQGANGYMDDYTCNYCDSGYTADKEGCLADSDADTDADEEDEVDADWKKYSDIDNAIEPTDRSYEAQQALAAYNSMIAKLVETFELSRDIEIENEMQAGLNEYRQAIVQNQKTNLLKAFWRLSWVTTSTIKSGVQAGSAYSKIMTSAGSAVQSIASGLKSFQALIPANSDLAIDKSTLTGQATSVGAKTALTAVESLGDPYKVATKFVQSAAEASVPSADISEAEINILKQQQINKGVVDQVLANSKAANAERQAKLTALEAEIKTLETQITEWENKEKERVASALVESCKKLTEQQPAAEQE